MPPCNARLNGGQDRGSYKVVNAGLGGTTIEDQSQILAGMLPDLGVTQVIWYPGSNDIGCSAPTSSRTSKPIRLPWPACPNGH